MDITKVGEFFSGVALTAVIWPVVKFLYDHLKAGEYLKGGAEKVLNLAGYKVYDKVLRHISDEEAKQKLTNDLDEAGNRGDAAWDKGIRGEKI